MKEHIRPLALWGVAIIGMISAHQEQAIFWAQMTGYAVAIGAGLANILSIWNKNKDEKIALLAKEHAEELKRLRAELIPLIVGHSKRKTPPMPSG